MRETSEGACPPSESRVLLFFGAACGFGLVITAPNDEVVCHSRTDEESERSRGGGVCRNEPERKSRRVTADTKAVADNEEVRGQGHHAAVV